MSGSGPSPSLPAPLAALLPKVSRSFFLSLRFLPIGLRGPLSLAYLLARTTDSLADEATAPLALRVESLRAFASAIATGRNLSLREAFPELRLSRPAEQHLLDHAPLLLSELHRLPENLQREIQWLLQIIAGGQTLDLTRFGYASAEQPVALQTRQDLRAYTYAVAGCVGEFWTRLCALTLPHWPHALQDPLVEHGRVFGQGLQLVNILRDLPEDLAAGRCYLPAEDLDRFGLRLETLRLNPKAVRPLQLEWAETAQRWLQHGQHYERLVPGIRLRFSVSLPRRIGLATLEALRLQPPLETSIRVKIPRSRVLLFALRSAGSALRPRRPVARR